MRNYYYSIFGKVGRTSVNCKVKAENVSEAKTIFFTDMRGTVIIHVYRITKKTFNDLKTGIIANKNY